MIWAAFTLAYFGFLRCSKFTCPSVGSFVPHLHLSRDDICFHPSIENPSHMKVVIKASKTDTFRQGSLLTIACSSHELCAVQAMRDYLSASHHSGPLFVFRSGRFLTRAPVSQLLRDAARAVGFPYKSLKGHSFRIGAARIGAARIGAASAAAAAGLPDWLIKVLGCWASHCYQLYIRTPQNVLLSVAPQMASVCLASPKS
jgi:hypothetical protein